jgi:hypothetical protein
MDCRDAPGATDPRNETLRWSLRAAVTAGNMTSLLPSTFSSTGSEASDTSQVNESPAWTDFGEQTSDPLSDCSSLVSILLMLIEVGAAVDVLGRKTTSTQ